MKLTQELIVAGVFLVGSWVTLSVVASAFPPSSSSSIRKALTSHAAPKRTEPLMTAIDLSRTAAPATAYLQDEKEPAVQVVTGDLAKNELYIFGENENVPEKIIEKHPEATIAVLGGDEADVSKKIEKFNIASKNVAIRIALAKEGALRQAEADFRKLQEWNEQKHHFNVEVKAKKFELPIPQLLNNTLQKMAEQPDTVLPNIGLDDNSTRADAGKQPKNRIILPPVKAKLANAKIMRSPKKMAVAPAKLAAPLKAPVRHVAVNTTAQKIAAIQHERALRLQKMAARERAIANIERQLATEPIIVTPPPVVERRIAEAEPARSVSESVRYRRYPTYREQARRRHPYQSKPVTASNSIARSEREIKEMTRRFHDPVEYSKLMEE